MDMFMRFKRLALIALALVFVSIGTGQAVVIVGSGSHYSYLVLEGPGWTGSPLVYQWWYDYDPLTPPDTYAMLTAVIAFDALLTASFANFGTEEDPNFFITAMTFDSISLAGNNNPPFTPYWSHWVSGGEAGFPFAVEVPTGVWSFGSGISDPYRWLAPGSWDGLVFGDGLTPPSIAPIPEPAAGFWILTAALAWRATRRKA